MRRWFERITMTPGREAAVAGMLAGVLFFVGTADVPIFGRDEARFAQAAREMLERGDLVVPTFAGEGRYHKPILHYWCTMASYPRARGQRAGGAAAVESRRRGGDRARRGLRAPPLPPRVGAAGRPAAGGDAGGVGRGQGLHRGHGAPAADRGGHARVRTAAGRRRGAARGLRVLVGDGGGDPRQGPGRTGMGGLHRARAVGDGTALADLELALAAALLGARLVAARAGGARGAGGAAVLQLLRSPDGRRVVARLHPQWGIPLLLAITVPWAVAATVATGGAFLREAVGTHVVARGLTPFESHGFFPGFYAVTAVAALFPWFGLLPAALSRQHRCRGPPVALPGRLAGRPAGASRALSDQARPLLDAVVPGRRAAGGGLAVDRARRTAASGSPGGSCTGSAAPLWRRRCSPCRP